MQTPLSRRAILAAGLGVLASPALARPPFRLRRDPQPLLSPPLLDEAGTEFRLSDFAGRVVLLNIWATWCPPCREEMPALEALEQQLGNENFMVMPLCIDEAGITRGRRFFDEIGIKRLALYWAEPLRVQLAFAFIGLPTTLLIDRQGNEIGRLQGPFDWNGGAAISQLSEVIG
jgi:thiol-disulfide isomerase/thioredoxin